MNSRTGLPVPQTSMLGGLGQVGLDPLPHQGRDHVRAIRVVRVARAVQVRQDQVDRVEPVLPLVGLALHGQHLLGQAVVDDAGMAGAGPEVVLLEVPFEVPGIAARRADVDDLADLRQPAASITFAPITRLL